jgi:hypothetical protein
MVTDGPSQIADIRLLIGGKFVDNSKTLAGERSETVDSSPPHEAKRACLTPCCYGRLFDANGRYWEHGHDSLSHSKGHSSTTGSKER